MSRIVPHSSSYANGIDIASNDSYVYILRSDLGCFLRTNDLSKGGDLQVYPLKENQIWGDHYLADDIGYCYMIKGDQVRRATNFQDNDGQNFPLTTKAQGGENYFETGGEFYVVNEQYCHATNSIIHDGWWTDTTGMSDSMAGGYYFWGDLNWCYCLKPGDQGTTYNQNTQTVDTWNPGQNLSLSNDVIKMLPGGVAAIWGPAFGTWVECSSSSISQTSGDNYSVTLQVGFDYDQVSNFTANWSLNDYLNAEALVKAMCYYQFLLDESFGGLNMDTSYDGWGYNYPEKMSESGQVPSGQTFDTMRVWQLVLGFGTTGEQKVLYTNVIVTPNSPPKPLPTTSSTARIGAKL